MFNWLFHPKPIVRRLRDELYHAQVEQLSHELQAEHHRALADMYNARADRLREQEFIHSEPKS